jgi:hypothetical protein
MKDAEPPKPVTLHFNRVRMPPEFDIESWVDQPVSSLVMRDPFPPPKAARETGERESAKRAASERLSDRKLRAALRAALRRCPSPRSRRL